MIKPTFTAGFESPQLPQLLPKPGPSQHAYVHIGATSAQKHTKVRKKKRAPSARFETSYQTKKKLLLVLDRLVEELVASGDRPRALEVWRVAARLRSCGSRFTAVTCGRHIVERRPHDRCGHRLCPFCAPKRSRKIVAKYLPMARAFLRQSPTPLTPCHLVLTMTHIVGETAVEARERLLSAFKKLTRRKLWVEHIAGGLYGIEIKVGKNMDGSWHAHMHLMVFRRRFFDVGLLKVEWFAVTGDSDVLRIDPITDLEKGLNEVVKYITKPMDIDVFTTNHVRQILDLKGKRMFAAFGEFAKFCEDFEPSDDDQEAAHAGYSEGDCCPFCDDPLFEVAMSVEELIDFARRIEAVSRSTRGSPLH